jgi:hypothetical protein
MSSNCRRTAPTRASDPPARIRTPDRPPAEPTHRRQIDLVDDQIERGVGTEAYGATGELRNGDLGKGDRVAGAQILEPAEPAGKRGMLALERVSA